MKSFRIVNIFFKNLRTSIVVGIILCSCFNNIAGQTNRYFNNNECWSLQHDEFSGVWSKYYMYTNGDSIIGSDTLVKFMLYGDEFFTWTHVGIIGSTTEPYFLAKENNRILTVYILNNGNIIDTVTTDYNRNDSLVYYTTVYNTNVGIEIYDTSLATYKGLQIEIDSLGTFGDQYSYEGIFDRYGSPFIDYHMPSMLLCFSATDSIFYSPDLYSDYQYHFPTATGNCVLNNVDILENDNIEFKIYPNPSTDYLIIVAPEGFILTDFIITDISGRQLRKGKLSSNLTVDLSFLNVGNYIIELNGAGFTKRRHFVKI